MTISAVRRVEQSARFFVVATLGLLVSVCKNLEKTKLALNLVLLLGAPELGHAAFSTSCRNLVEMLSIIPPIFVLLGLLDVWVPRETMMKFMGKGAGVKGRMFAFALLRLSMNVAGIVVLGAEFIRETAVAQSEHK